MAMTHMTFFSHMFQHISVSENEIFKVSLRTLLENYLGIITCMPILNFVIHVLVQYRILACMHS